MGKKAKQIYYVSCFVELLFCCVLSFVFVCDLLMLLCACLCCFAFVVLFVLCFCFRGGPDPRTVDLRIQGRDEVSDVLRDDEHLSWGDQGLRGSPNPGSRPDLR